MTLIRRLTIWIASMTVAMLMMAVVLAGAAHAATPEPAGEWRGTLSAQGVQLRVGVSIQRASGGALSGVLTSPDQTPEPIALADIRQDGEALSFVVPEIGARYEAHWDAGQQAWVGTFVQGLTLPLVLSRGPVAAH